MDFFYLLASFLLINLFTTIFAQIQLNGKCKTPNRSNGICKPLRQCEGLYNLLHQSPLTTQNKDFLSKSQCGYQDKQVLVCCSDSLKNLPEPGVCGVSVTDRIIGGVSTALDEYPWMALLQYNKPNNKSGFHCGGVLIHERYVLTASHCVNGKDLPPTWTLYSVRLGEWDLTTNPDCETFENDIQECADPVLDIPILEKIPHEEYEPSANNKVNDIALLKLESIVIFTFTVQPICLPTADYLKTFNFHDVSFDIAGWGKTESSSRSNIKKKASVDGVGINKCYNIYQSEGIILGNKQMCAGGSRGFDSCRGDSGGPLMTIDNTAKMPYWFLAGIISFGPSPCGQENWPGVYTRVGSFVDWIESKID